MVKSKMVSAVILVVFFLVHVVAADELKDNWSDFLHYTKIGRFDLAKRYGQALLDANPDPVALHGLTLANPQGYDIMLRVHESAPDRELAAITEKVIAVVDQGQFVRRSDPSMVVLEVRRLSSTERGKMIAMKRLKDAGEFAIPFLLDVIANPNRRAELPNVVWVLPRIGQQAVRPLAAALLSANPAVKAEVISAMGQIGYPQSLPYLKHVGESESSDELRSLATRSMQKIDPTALGVSAAELFFMLAEKYYDHHASLAAESKAGMSNVWFWDTEKRRLVWNVVDSRYFHELMAMRCCEWALQADPEFGRAIGLWLASFFKAEATGEAMPSYFGQSHADASVYAATAGPEYLHQALARGLDDGDRDVALGATEALIVTAGQKAIFVPVGPVQPLLQALIFADAAVRYTAAIAIATAGPQGQFDESGLVMENLAEAIHSGATGGDPLDARYAERSVKALITLASQGSRAFQLAKAQGALVEAVAAGNDNMKVWAAQVLAHIDSPAAQAEIAKIALSSSQEASVRVQAFQSLATSAKLFGSMLDENLIAQVYELLGSSANEPELRAASAAAFGALNLPSRRVKDLILDQARR